VWALSNLESSRLNADDRLSLDPVGRVESGEGSVEGSHVADVCLQMPNASDSSSSTVNFCEQGLP
jgi:hypothetical protein